MRAAWADLRAAELLAKDGLFPSACFHCHQAAGKALKAYLYGQGEEDVRGHSVAALCQAAATLEPVFAELGEQVGELDGYYIPTRYPNGLVDATAEQVFGRAAADRAIGMARRACDFVQERLEGR